MIVGDDYILHLSRRSVPNLFPAHLVLLSCAGAGALGLWCERLLVPENRNGLFASSLARLLPLLSNFACYCRPLTRVVQGNTTTSLALSHHELGEAKPQRGIYLLQCTHDSKLLKDGQPRKLSSPSLGSATSGLRPVKWSSEQRQSICKLFTPAIATPKKREDHVQ